MNFEIDAYGILIGTDGDDILIDSADLSALYGGTGDDQLVGLAGEYSQADYNGFASEYIFLENADGSVTVTHAIWGTDTLTNIDGIWFGGQREWVSLDSVLSLPATTTPVDPAPIDPIPETDFVVDEFGILIGDDNDNTLYDTSEINSLFGGLGNDHLVGLADEYSQADYNGFANEYTFTQNANGTVTVQHAEYGTDTLTNIDGVWFGGQQEWMSIDQLTSFVTPAPVDPAPVEPEPQPEFEVDEFGILIGDDNDNTLYDTSEINSLFGGLGNDQLIGLEGEYSQADYNGFADEYTFTQNANGTVTVQHAEYGTDTLTNIDGVWFGGQQEWMSIEQLTGSTPVNPAPVDPAPVDPAPVDPAPVDPAPVDPAPVDPDPVDPTGPNTGVLVDGVITGSNDVDDTLIGDAGNNVFFAGRGTDLIQGGAGNDTLRVDGDIFEWTFSANADGSVTMTHPTWGENTLVGIEQILSQRSGETFSIDEAIASTDGLPRFRLDNDNVINGTNGDDVIPGGTDVQGFYGGTGDDVFFGTGDFEQVNYDGSRSEYSITQNGDGSITVDHPIWGTDTLNDIDALIFTGVEPGVGGDRSGPFEFISTDDLFA